MISVTVPVYRVENYIAQTIDTVVQQTYPDWELILVDDKSPDGSVEAAEKKIATLPDPVADKIRIIKKPVNEGAAKARNTGLDAARGRYIAFLDADDLVHHLFVNMKSSGGIKDDNVVSVLGGVCHSSLGNLHRINIRAHGKHLYAKLLTIYL